MGKYADTIINYRCPPELAHFTEYMAECKRYASMGSESLYSGDWAGYIPVKFALCEDYEHHVKWRFNDWNRYANGSKYITKELTAEGINTVMHYLNASFRTEAWGSAIDYKMFSDMEGY